MFTKQEIKLLKQYVNITGIARKHGLSIKSNYIYKLLRKDVVEENSKGHKALMELKQELAKIKKNCDLSKDNVFILICKPALS